MMKTLFLFVFLFFLHGASIAQQPEVPVEKTSPALLEAFMEKRFGMFIHWGPVALRGTEIGWSRGHQVAVEDYDNLYKEFNPVLFNANEWVKAAKDAGMKYIVITSKHHDGFCLWPSKYTEYDIASTVYKKDIMAQLSKACREQGIAFGIYFTVLDWHDALYPVSNLKGAAPKPTADMKKFVELMKNQISELITNYHPFMFWFDGNWEGPWTQSMGEEIYAHIKKLDKKIIVNNRIGKGDHDKFSDKMVGDYLTPEQKIGKINMQHPWESCITIGKQWAWKPNDSLKSTYRSLQILASTVGGNGNLLYNVGPMPDGRIEARQVKVLGDMGNWLRQNGEAVYATKGGPYHPNLQFACTRKGKKIFIHLLNREAQSISLPVLPGATVIKAYLASTKQAVSFIQDAGSIVLNLSEINKEDLIPVITLETDIETSGIPLIEVGVRK